MSTQFDTAGMPSFNHNTQTANGHRNTNTGNPNGDIVDRTAGDNPIDQKAQGLSTAMGGADLNMQSKPSWLY
jgi:hypothetical protein